MRQHLELIDSEIFDDNTIKVILKFESEEIVRKIAKKYLEFRIYITIKIDENKLEIVYPSDSWGSTEEIDNELDIMDYWIENGEI
jgi:hypothetical protein